MRGHTTYAVITARGGSKSIPRKNLAQLGGKPLIAWTLEAALSSPSVSRVIVSTDDEEIGKVSMQWGAEVPFLRPRELAGDDSPHVPVVIHAVEWIRSHDHASPEYVLLLQPTLPFRTSLDIEQAMDLITEKNAESVVSVTEAPCHPYLVKSLTEDGRLKDFVETPAGYLRRQALPPAYAINGAIYLVRSDVLLAGKTFYAERTYAYVMPPERSLDIDTPWDLHLADLLMKERISHERH
jgi:CMP-N,N'-diacetyllegionaminic acid synthase